MKRQAISLLLILLLVGCNSTTQQLAKEKIEQATKQIGSLASAAETMIFSDNDQNKADERQNQTTTNSASKESTAKKINSVDSRYAVDFFKKVGSESKPLIYYLNQLTGEWADENNNTSVYVYLLANQLFIQIEDQYQSINSAVEVAGVKPINSGFVMRVKAIVNNQEHSWKLHYKSGYRAKLRLETDLNSGQNFRLTYVNPLNSPLNITEIQDAGSDQEFALDGFYLGMSEEAFIALAVNHKLTDKGYLCSGNRGEFHYNMRSTPSHLAGYSYDNLCVFQAGDKRHYYGVSALFYDNKAQYIELGSSYNKAFNKELIDTVIQSQGQPTRYIYDDSGVDELAVWDYQTGSYTQISGGIKMESKRFDSLVDNRKKAIEQKKIRQSKENATLDSVDKVSGLLTYYYLSAYCGRTDNELHSLIKKHSKISDADFNDAMNQAEVGARALITGESASNCPVILDNAYNLKKGLRKW